MLSAYHKNDGDTLFLRGEEKWESADENDVRRDINALQRGKSLCFAVVSYDEYYQEDDEILVWAHNERNTDPFMRKVKGLAAWQYDRKHGVFANHWKYATRLISRERANKLYEQIQHATAYGEYAALEYIAKINEPFTPEDIQATMHLYRAWSSADNRRESAEFLRKAMNSGAFDMLRVDGETVFQFRTRVIDALISAEDHWKSLHSGDASYYGITVVRVGRGWDGKIVKLAEDSCWGFYLQGSVEYEEYFQSSADDLMPVDTTPSSPEQAYFNTFN